MPTLTRAEREARIARDDGYEHEYAVQDALVCTNHETALGADDTLPREAAGGQGGDSS